MNKNLRFLTLLAFAGVLAGLTACGDGGTPPKRPKTTGPAVTKPVETNVVDTSTNTVDTTVTETNTTTTATPAETGPRYAEAMPGKPGFVYSPYVGTSGPVDVRDANGNQLPRGTEVRCPYTRKTFLVP